MQPSHDYFSRLVAVPEIGEAGLERLRSSRAAILGVGGVGSAAAFYLAGLGIGHLRLIDQDIVEPSNLSRLHGLTRDHLYHPKAEALAEVLAKSRPWTNVEPVVETLRSTNAGGLLNGVDVIVDGLDNFRTRYLVNRFSLETRTPYVFASAVSNQGHVGLFQPPATGCLECAMPNVVDRPEESCEKLGVTPTITGLVGVLAANEASKVIIRVQSGLRGRLLTIDTLVPDFILTEISKREDCRACASPTPLGKDREGDIITTLCGERTVNVLPESAMNLDLSWMSRSISKEVVLTASDTVLVYRMGSLNVTLFRTGRVLIEGVQGMVEGLRVAREIWSQARDQPRLLA